MAPSKPVCRKPELVTIVIPTWNRQDTACIALHTAVHQSYAELEIIVVDDGSDVPFCSDIDDARVRVLRLTEHQGLAHARNAGMAAARGAYIAFLDDDDCYYPDKIARQLMFLQDRPDLDGVFSRVVVVDAVGNKRRYLPDGFVHNTSLNFRYYNVIHTNSALLRRKVCTQVKWDERLTKYTDMQFFLEVSRQFKMAYLNGDVALWYKQNRADQVTAEASTKLVMYRHNCQNFTMVCSIFHDTIVKSFELRVRYYGRLFFASLKALEWSRAVRCLRSLLTGARCEPQSSLLPDPVRKKLGYSSGQ